MTYIISMPQDKCPFCDGLKDVRSIKCRKCNFPEFAERECTGCKKILSISKFRLRTRKIPRPRSQCKKCEANDRIIRDQNRSPQSRMLMMKCKKNWVKNNPEKVAMHVLRRRFTRISHDNLDQLVEKYLKVSKCEICDRDIKEVGTLHIDHDHNSNAIRGFICTGCNIGLGQFKDNIESLKNAIEYLKKTSCSDFQYHLL